MPEYDVRDAVESDLEMLWKLQKEMLVVQGFTNIHNISIDEFKDFLFGEHPTTNFKVCGKGTGSSFDLVGFVSYFFGVSFPHGNIVYIEDLYVKEEHRRSGVGKMLLKAATSVATSRGCRKAMLHCAKWNDRAYGLYKHIGMKDEDSRILYFDKEGLEKFCSN